MSRQGKPRTRTYEHIKDFWEKEASEIGNTPLVTIRDHYFRIHEIYTYLPLIPRCSKLLDIGCGTGLSTMFFARRAEHTVGVDYSGKMIEWAHKLIKDADYRRNISMSYSPFIDISYTDGHKFDLEFKVGDIFNLNNIPHDFDVITGQRILINLSSHNDQINAIKQLRGHIAYGGMLLLTEATQQGHKRTDEYRSYFGLPILEKYWHNNYVDENRFDDWEKAGWLVKNNFGFETYMLLSKVIYPASVGQDNCKFISGANAAAMELSCLFRTKHAVAEIGDDAFFQMYINRVKNYDLEEGNKIDSWISKNLSKLPDWTGIGHQRLIIATAC